MDPSQIPPKKFIQSLKKSKPDPKPLDFNTIIKQSNKDSEAIQDIYSRFQNVVGTAELEIKYKNIL